jgi:hypothetical protein
VQFFALNRRGRYAKPVGQATCACWGIAQDRRQAVGAIAEVEAAGVHALGLVGDYTTLTRQTASAFFPRRAFVANATGAVAEIHAAVFDTLHGGSDHTDSTRQATGTLFSAGTKKSSAWRVVTLVDTVRACTPGGSQNLTSSTGDTTSATRRVAGNLRAEHTVTKVYAAHELALIGIGFNAGRTSRALNTTRALVRPAAGDCSARHVIALINATMVLAVGLRYNHAIAVWQATGAANDTAATKSSGAGNSITLINAADIPAFVEGRIDALSGSRNTACAGRLGIVIAVRLTTGDIVAAIDATGSRAFTGGQVGASAGRQTKGAANRRAVDRRASRTGREDTTNIRAFGRQIGYKALAGCRNTAGTVDYADILCCTTGAVTHVIPVLRDAVLCRRLSTASKQTAGAVDHL